MLVHWCRSWRRHFSSLASVKVRLAIQRLVRLRGGGGGGGGEVCKEGDLKHTEFQFDNEYRA